jgi:hypothetical protein
MPSLFSTPIEKCDVKDLSKLACYREKAVSWYDLLHNDKEHSISGQYSDMMWQDAAWHLANEARRYTFEDGPTAAITPILGKLIDQGYVMGQVIALSKLLEKSNPKQPKKGVISIRRIVDEMYHNRNLFSREIFVAGDGYPYDWYTAPGSTSSKGVSWINERGPDGWMLSSFKHEAFDKLSGTTAGSRSRDDCISDEIFERLQAKLDDPVFNIIKNLRDKRIAHAADLYSRDQVENLKNSLKFDELNKAHYILTGVIQSVSVALLPGYRLGSSVPIEQPDAFNYFDMPFIQPHRKREYYQFWSKHSQKRERWLTDAFNEVLPELKS